MYIKNGAFSIFPFFDSAKKCRSEKVAASIDNSSPYINQYRRNETGGLSSSPSWGKRMTSTMERQRACACAHTHSYGTDGCYQTRRRARRSHLTLIQSEASIISSFHWWRKVPKTRAKCLASSPLLELAVGQGGGKRGKAFCIQSTLPVRCPSQVKALAS